MTNDLVPHVQNVRHTEFKKAKTEVTALSVKETAALLCAVSVAWSALLGYPAYSIYSHANQDANVNEAAMEQCLTTHQNGPVSQYDLAKRLFRFSGSPPVRAEINDVFVEITYPMQSTGWAQYWKPKFVTYLLSKDFDHHFAMVEKSHKETHGFSRSYTISMVDESHEARSAHENAVVNQIADCVRNNIGPDFAPKVWGSPAVN